MANESINKLIGDRYKYGFTTDVESESFPPGLNEDVITALSKKKEEPEYMLEWRLKAYKHWLTLDEPDWAHIGYPKIDYQDISYYSAPNQMRTNLKVSMKLIQNFSKHMTNWESRYMKEPDWLVLQLMPYLIVSLLLLHLRKNYPRQG